ncbi:MAG: sigma-54 dependent transcriptional regulator [Firmicutes bacterium]|nr:sigma-54 dependent transcriptional regulator [Bacillota bacterium]
MGNELFKILVVDDEKEYCAVIKMILENCGYSVVTCGSGKEALEILERANLDLVISDLKMNGMSGYELLEEIKRREYDVEVIMLTAFGTIETAVEAMKLGAYTYVTKGNDPEELLMEVAKVRSMRDVNRENMVLREKTSVEYMLESRNEKYNNMLTLVERAASSNSNILILGESGSGKEVLASFIHSKSQRRDKNLMELNCQAISESILESELFGHEKGSFTGAAQRRIGHFEAANGGTLFLDEIGGVSMGIQAKLLKAIENKVIYRMGSSTPVNVDFRLITATNRNLQKDMEEGTFRSDLFYRISTIVLELPPLRERREDIPLFIDFFLDKFGREMKKENITVPESVRTLLENYSYPGNIRELKNLIERLLVLSEHGEIKEEYLPPEIFRNKGENGSSGIYTDYTESLRAYRQKAEKKYIEELIARYPSDLNTVAEILSITRRQLLNKMNDYNLK